MALVREVRLVLALALTTIPTSARADVDLVVTRDSGAEECPDAVQVRRLALAATAPSSPPAAHAYHVSFDRSGGAYRVEIVDDTAGRSRRLEDTAAGCGSLGQAAAVVMATMWSSERDAASPSPPLPPAIVRDRPPPSNPSRAPVRRWAVGVGGAITTAIVRSVAPALLGEGAMEVAHGSLAFGALWIPEQRFDLPPGSIGVELFSGSLRGCAFWGDATHLGFCGSILAGALFASGTGYSMDAQRTRPWFAVEPQVFVDRALFAGIRCRGAAGAVIPLHAESFSVAGAGVAYAPPPIGALVSISLEMVRP